MKSTLQLMVVFIFFLTFSVVGNGQGIGDRNRAASSNGGSFSILGRVLMPDGRPAQGVKVSVTNADSSAMEFTTAEDGSFQTGDINAGNYTVSAKVEGLAQVSELVMIDRDAPTGQTRSVVLYLRMPGQKKGDIYSVNPLFKDVPSSALDKFKKGADKMRTNDAKAAIPLFDAAIAEYPNFAAAYFERGTAYLRENDVDKALESFVKAVTIKPDYVEAKYGYGKAMFEKKNYEVAEAVFRDVLKTNPDMAEAHLNLGISLFHLKNGVAAESELKAAIAAKGGDRLALAHLYLGQIYVMKKLNADAVVELQKYVELVPKAPNIEKIKATIADLKKQG